MKVGAAKPGRTPTVRWIAIGLVGLLALGGAATACGVSVPFATSDADKPSSESGARSPTMAPSPRELSGTKEPGIPAPFAVASPSATGGPSIDCDARDVYRTGLVAAAQRTLDDLQGASVYCIDVAISPDRTSIVGHETLHYTNRENVVLLELYLRLYPNVSGGQAVLAGLMVDGIPAEIVLEARDSAARVILPQPLQPGDRIVLETEFRVEVPTQLGGRYGLFGYTDGVLALDEFYPVVPVYDDQGWNVDAADEIGDLTYLDASFYRVSVTAPADLTLVATGIAVDARASGGQQTVAFAAGPARDFYLAAGDNYTVVGTTVGEVTINSYAPPGQVGSAEFAMQVAAHALRSFGERLGPYPYTELDVFALPMRAAGIEYPGAVGIALALYDAASEPGRMASRDALESVIAHEVAHQWFYNVVGNDQVDDPWLDEAVVQYATWLYYVDAYGVAEARRHRDSWEQRWERVDRAEMPIGLPSREYQPAEYGAIVYGRGPLFVEALAEELGGQAFSAFLRAYYEEHMWSIATPESFQQLAEKHCDCDLDGLFEEWVYGSGSAGP